MIVTIPASNIFLNAALGKAHATQWTLRLYTDDKFTEAQGGGYAPVPLRPGSWITTEVDRSAADYPPQTFRFTGPLNGDGTPPSVRGFYVTDAADIVLFSEGLKAPFTPVNDGDSLVIDVRFSLGVVGS